MRAGRGRGKVGDGGSEIFHRGSEVVRAERRGDREEFIKRLLFGSVGAGGERECGGWGSFADREGQKVRVCQCTGWRQWPARAPVEGGRRPSVGGVKVVACSVWWWIAGFMLG